MWTYEKRLQYQTYDITAMLKNGENKIEIGVGLGWMMQDKSFEDVKMIASIEIENENGENIAVFSIRPDDGYIRFDVVDKFQKRANTNAYFLDMI